MTVFVALARDHREFRDIALLETFSFVKLEFAFPPARRRRSPEALRRLSSPSSRQWIKGSHTAVRRARRASLLRLKFHRCCPPKETSTMGTRRKVVGTRLSPFPLERSNDQMERDASDFVVLRQPVAVLSNYPSSRPPSREIFSNQCPTSYVETVTATVIAEITV